MKKRNKFIRQFVYEDYDLALLIGIFLTIVIINSFFG